MNPSDHPNLPPVATPSDRTTPAYRTSPARCAPEVSGSLPALQPPAELYHCPGERAPISRAVHLGRLAQYYPPCRKCVHGRHAEGLSPRRARRLAELRNRRGERPLFDAEGAGGTWLNDLKPAAVRALGQAFGLWLRENQRGHSAGQPLAVMAGDGRAPAAELLAALGDGLRWAGCQVIEAGLATAACVGLAIGRSGAAGGVLVGNPAIGADEVRLSFFDDQALPLSAGGGLEALEALLVEPVSRPARRLGTLRRVQIEEDYLRKLGPWYHGLRPLRVVLDAASPGPAELLQRLIAPTACRFVRSRVGAGQFGEEVRRQQAHLGVRIDGNAERCEVFDETGGCVPDEQWLVLLARCRLAQRTGAPIVLGGNSPAGLKTALGRLGLEVQLVPDSRRELTRAARSAGALLAGDAAGRCWLDLAGPAMADALQVVTLLLSVLSQSDRPLSQVLREAAA